MSAALSFLTRRQQEVLDFLVDYHQRHGIAPTLREICEHFGFASFASAHKHLKLLQQKGFVSRDWNQKRGLVVERQRESPVAAELPFHGWIAAGQPFEAVATGDTLSVPGHLLAGPEGEHFVLRVVGTSMVDEGIFDGDLVVVRRRDRADSGEMVVALLGDEATLKRYYLEGRTVRLQPANPTMRPIQVPASDVQVQGVVVGLMRRF